MLIEKVTFAIKSNFCQVTRTQIPNPSRISRIFKENTNFTPEGIIKNNRSIITICENSLDKNDIILVSVVSPFNQTRTEARKRLGRKYLEVYVKARLAAVINKLKLTKYNRVK